MCMFADGSWSTYVQAKSDLNDFHACGRFPGAFMSAGRSVHLHLIDRYESHLSNMCVGLPGQRVNQGSGTRQLCVHVSPLPIHSNTAKALDFPLLIVLNLAHL